jgi:hypothetical protein
VATLLPVRDSGVKTHFIVPKRNTDLPTCRRYPFRAASCRNTRTVLLSIGMNMKHKSCPMPQQIKKQTEPCIDGKQLVKNAPLKHRGVSANELYRPSDRRLSAKLVPSFANRGVRCVQCNGSPWPCSQFLDRSLYFLFQISPQLYSRDWVDPVPDPLLLRRSGSAENRTWTSGSVARNSYY